MTIAHFSINTTMDKYAETVAFYKAALAPLGYTHFMDMPEYNVIGMAAKPGNFDFWVFGKKDFTPGNEAGAHFAFGAADKKAVAAWHAAAVAAGGKDNGAPGPRPQYTPTYFGAFVIDPMGNNIEAVSHDALEE